MAWHKRRRGVIPTDGKKVPIGEGNLQRAITQVRQIAHRYAAATVPQQDYTLRDVINWLFPEKVMSAAVAAHGLIKLYPSWSPITSETYPLPLSWGCYAEITLDLKNVCPPIKAEHGSKDFEAPQLRKAVTALYQIHREFGVVEHVVDWLGHNATVGAFRYYFPPITTLIASDKGSAFAFPEGGTVRTPNGIAAKIPMIREALGTLAKGLMAPVDKRVSVNTINVNFGQETREGVTYPSRSFSLELLA